MREPWTVAFALAGSVLLSALSYALRGRGRLLERPPSTPVGASNGSA